MNSFDYTQNQDKKLEKSKYKIINEYKLKNQEISSLNFNSHNLILFVGIGKKIKIFKFVKNSLQLIGIYLNNREHFSNIYLMKISNLMISGDSEGYLKVFQLNDMKQTRYIQKFKGHFACLSCIAMSIQENEIITSSVNSTIKFWNQKNNWKCFQTIDKHRDLLLGFSLNEQGNQLISYGFDDFILVIEKSKNNKLWQVIQKISNKMIEGGRISFISNVLFFIQPKQKDIMIVYSKKDNEKIFSYTSEIKLQASSSGLDCLSKQQFLRSKLLLITKLGQYVNCIRLNEDGSVIFQDYKDLGNSNFKVLLTDDANYLFVANKDFHKLQIRQYF
ncbi:unnamed protein product [Paramecium sonneborni]|uniref:WD40-repeat-containing domain n=1 Tax=Paramecium sonneborni TaxID=65129 RepID=A0A8S1LDM0_9CILI|nr:unnamed protein product [Paramecium sonneborni]